MIKYIVTFCLLSQALMAQSSDPRAKIDLDSLYEGSLILCRQKLTHDPKDQSGLLLLAALQNIKQDSKDFNTIHDQLLNEQAIISNTRLIDEGEMLSSYSLKQITHTEAIPEKQMCIVIAYASNPKNPKATSLYKKYIKAQFLKKFLQPISLVCDIEDLSSSPEEKRLNAFKQVEIKTLSFETDDLLKLINYMIPRADAVGFTIIVKSLPEMGQLRETKTTNGHTLYSSLRTPIHTKNAHKFTNTNLAELLDFIDLTYRIKIQFEGNKIILSAPEDTHWKANPLSFKRAQNIQLFDDFEVGTEAFTTIYKKQSFVQLKGTLGKITKTETEYQFTLSEGLQFNIPNSQVNLTNLAKIHDTLQKHLARPKTSTQKLLEVIIRADISQGINKLKTTKIFLPNASIFLTKI